MNSTDKHIIQEHPQFAINGLFIIIHSILFAIAGQVFLHSSKWYLTLIFATQADSGAVQFSQRAAETFRRLSQSDTLDSSCSPGCSCGRRRECEKGLPADRSVENPYADQSPGTESGSRCVFREDACRVGWKTGTGAHSASPRIFRRKGASEPHRAAEKECPHASQLVRRAGFP